MWLKKELVARELHYIMAAPSSVQHSLALVTRGVTLEPKSTFVVPRRAHRLKKTQIKADEAFALASAKLKPKENLLSELGAQNNGCVTLLAYMPLDRLCQPGRSRRE